MEQGSTYWVKTCATCIWNNCDNIDISDYHHSIQLLHRQLHHHYGLFVMNIYRNVSALDTILGHQICSLVTSQGLHLWSEHAKALHGASISKQIGLMGEFMIFLCFIVFFFFIVFSFIELPHPNSCKTLKGLGNKNFSRSKFSRERTSPPCRVDVFFCLPRLPGADQKSELWTDNWGGMNGPV